MKILVTGSDGMLGWGIKEAFKDHEIHYTDKTNLDITDYNQVMFFARYNYDAIIHCAAETNHYVSELVPAKAYNVNTIGTAHVCDLALKCKATMVYIGTCGMFGGEKDFYSPEDTPNPLNHYGRSKYYGEMIVSSMMQQYYILRAGWMMGGGIGIDHKFIGQIYKQVKEGTDVYAINDVYGTPTYAIDFASCIKSALVNKLIHKTYNFQGGRASRYDVAKEFVNLLGNPVNVIPISYDEYHAKHPVKVPYTKCEALEYTEIDENMDWEESLRDYIERCF